MQISASLDASALDRAFGGGGFRTPLQDIVSNPARAEFAKIECRHLNLRLLASPGEDQTSF